MLHYLIGTSRLIYLLLCVLSAGWQELSEEKHNLAMQNEYNFDCPDAFDTDCIVKILRRLKEGKSVEIPVYNFTTHRADKKKVSCLCHFFM